MSAITLTPDQQAAYNTFVEFITHPDEKVLVISGYAGTGKTTLVAHILEQLPSLLYTLELLTAKKQSWDIKLTATTNKAVDALIQTLKVPEASTIQSALSLRVDTDYRTGKTSLSTSVAPGAILIKDTILIIDESSFIDSELLHYIFAFTNNCKIIFLGDPAQLAPVNNRSTPVFNAGFKTVTLTQVVRQATGNPIIDLATSFREVVNGADWGNVNVDGSALRWLPRAEFEQEIFATFQKAPANLGLTKVLAYTNKCVTQYNQAIRQVLQGSQEFKPGELAICNHYFTAKPNSILTDQLVRVTRIKPQTKWNVSGWEVTVNKEIHAFLPASLDAKRKRLKLARANNEWNVVKEITENWIDLRAAYACTINKSQGSTYDEVFIDLDDLRTCRNPNTLARLLYVAVSRARYRVTFTGDLVDQNSAAA